MAFTVVGGPVEDGDVHASAIQSVSRQGNAMGGGEHMSMADQRAGARIRLQRVAENANEANLNVDQPWHFADVADCAARKL
jgi:hypothetical protein